MMVVVAMTTLTLTRGDGKALMQMFLRRTTSAQKQREKIDDDGNDDRQNERPDETA